MKEAHASDQEREKERAKIVVKYKYSFCNYANAVKSRVIVHERIHTGDNHLAVSAVPSELVTIELWLSTYECTVFQASKYLNAPSVKSKLKLEQ